MKRPVFKPHLQVVVIPGEGVLTVSEGDVSTLHGRVYELLAPLLDGTRDEDSLVDALAAELDGAEVYYALATLEKEGYVTEFEPDIPLETAVFWYGLGIDPRQALEILKSTRVRVRAVGGAEAEPLRLALANFGAVSVEGKTADFEIVAADDYLRPELDDVNTESLRTGRPWLLVKPVGHELWIGPLFVPGRTGCHRCLAVRLERHRIAHCFAAQKSRVFGAFSIAAMQPSYGVESACRLAALEAVKFMAGAKEGLTGKVLSLNLRTGKGFNYELLRHPFCPSCGEIEMAEPRPVELVRRRAAYTLDGGYRAVEPIETIKKYERLVSPITGVVKMLAPVIKNDGPIHVYVAGHTSALKIEGLDFLKKNLRNASAGKGMSDAQAKAGALGEAVEIYSAERTGGEVGTTANYREMRQRCDADAIHPNDVMLFSERQMAERETWNSTKSCPNRVVVPLDETVPIDWTPVWSLTHNRYKYLPTQLLYYQTMTVPDDDAFYCISCFNGNASGNNLEEAVLHGFCELAERDAVALWWYNRLRKPGVDTESFQEAYILDIIDYYRSQGREAWALDITGDLEIPTFTAVSRDIKGLEEKILFGFGCHLDPRIALQRAFTEMNQILALVIGNGENKLDNENTEILSWLTTATKANQPYITPEETVPLKRREDFTDLSSDDLLEDINLCRSIVEGRGMEMLVLDQTRRDVGMPAVKVIVPGLRHFRARFAPGRLYDVPVQMGWLETHLKEEELNPIPFFL